MLCKVVSRAEQVRCVTIRASHKFFFSWKRPYLMRGASFCTTSMQSRRPRNTCNHSLLRTCCGSFKVSTEAAIAIRLLQKEAEVVMPTVGGCF